MSRTSGEHNLVQRRKRISKARRKKINKERDIKYMLATSILSDVEDTMSPLNPLEKRNIIEDGIITAEIPAEVHAKSALISYCVVC